MFSDFPNLPDFERWKEPGKKACIILTGGGAKGFRQICRTDVLLEFLESRGIKIKLVFASSVGACNGIGICSAPSLLEGAKKTARIWRENICHPWQIYRLHPTIKNKLPPTPHFSLRGHATKKVLFYSFHKFISDLFNLALFALKGVVYVAIEATNLLKRFLVSSSDPSSKFDISPEHIIEALGLSNTEAVYDPAPLISTLLKEVSLEEVITHDVELCVLAKRNEDGKEEVFRNSDFAPAVRALRGRINELKADAEGITDTEHQEYKSLQAEIEKNEHELKEHCNQFFRCVLASMALRPAFVMQEIKNNEGVVYNYTDGDMANPLPVGKAIEAGCNPIFVIMNNPLAYAPMSKKLGKALDEILWQASYSHIFSKLKGAQRKAKERNVDVYIFCPKGEQHPALGVLSINPEAIRYHTEEDPIEIIKILKRVNEYNLRELPSIKEISDLQETQIVKPF